MIVTLLKDARMFSMTLPERVSGQHWVSDADERGKLRKLISIEAINGKWVIRSNKNVDILDEENRAVSNVIFNEQTFLNLKVRNSDSHAVMFSEPITANRQVFQKIIVKEPCEISIGRTTDNNICYQNQYVSSEHAHLVFDGVSWAVMDDRSKNGTFVNGYRIQSRTLFPGDCIRIMGLKIITCGMFFAINNPDDCVTLSSRAFLPFLPQEIVEREDAEEIEELDYFYRSPKFKKRITTAEIKIDPPPATQVTDKVPLALMLGPSITMGLASMSTGLLTVSNVINSGGDIASATPTLVMSGSMLLGMVFWPILTKKYEKKQSIKNEKKRQEKYFAYLDSVRDEIRRKCREQEDILRTNIVSTEECADRVLQRRHDLWERALGQDDFLRVRLGIGDLPLDADIKYPEKKFTLDDDNLQDALYSLGGEPKQLQKVPVSISLFEDTVVGIIGNRPQVLPLMRSILLQLVALHSYDELKIMLIADEEELSEWQFAKWFPHLWNDTKTQRYFASAPDEVKEISAVLEKIYEQRTGEYANHEEEYFPHYLIVCGSKELANKCESLRQILEMKTSRGFSIVTLYDELKNLPKETAKVVEVDGGQSRIFDKNDTAGGLIRFAAEGAGCPLSETVTDSLANIQLDVYSQRYTLPTMITFLEMFHVGKIEHLNPLTRWKENNPVVSLQTPVGADTFGGPFLLDLHEKYHGPHGLVAGMTGSGKSEFIITYILSLAVNYHPNEVSFILIDYKGGGLTGAFEDEERGIKLPHLAGTITNLDGAAVKRSLISIQSELRRRQAIFNEARRVSNEGTMDIYKYQQLFRAGVVHEPVPHLFIISDEFAELKMQQPEFMEQLVSAARIGRSLGIHLILATQKPSGVVDDQIWSNSRFRICLKVQEKADSVDMIKRPDAAELSATGRFFLQVGFNELFAMGQSAWCGAPYIPADKVEQKRDESVSVIDHAGRVLAEMKPSKKGGRQSANTKQIVAVVKHLSDLAKEEKVQTRALWLPAIPALIYVGDLEKKYSYAAHAGFLNPVVGEYDDPFNQRQALLTLPISEDGNCVLYGAAGSGKGDFLTTVLYSLITHQSAEDLTLYLLDFGAETLRAFEKAPQVGGVVYATDAEKLSNLFKMLERELERRKQLFSDYGGSFASYRKSAKEKVPNILIVLNNYSGFSEQYEDLEESFSTLSREGVSSGIYFLVTASTTNAVRYRLMQNFKLLWTLQINDVTDYPIIVGKTDGLVPSKIDGRGLVNLGEVYEFQTARCAPAEDVPAFLREYCTELREKAKTTARSIPILPNVVDFDAVKNAITTIEKLPIAYGRKTLQPYFVNLENQYIYPILAQELDAIAPMAACLARVCAAAGAKVTVVDRGGLLGQMPACQCYGENAETGVQEIFAEVLRRNNEYKDAKDRAKKAEEFERSVCILIGFADLMESLSEDGKDKLRVLLDKGEATYRIHFFIAESAATLSNYSYDAWYAKYMKGADGLFIGEGFPSQYILKSTRVTNDMYEEISPEFGFAIAKNKATPVKVLTTENTGWGENDDE